MAKVLNKKRWEMWQALDTFNTIISVASKVNVIAESGVNAYQLIKKEGKLTPQEKFQLSAEIITGIFQAVDIGVGVGRITNTNHAETLKAVQIFTSSSTAVCHIGKEVIPRLINLKGQSVDDWASVAAVIMFRISDVTGVVTSPPEFRADVHQFCIGVGKCSGAAGNVTLLFLKRQKIKSAAGVISNWARRQFQPRRSTIPGQRTPAINQPRMQQSSSSQPGIPSPQAQALEPDTIPVMTPNLPPHMQNEQGVNQYYEDLYQRVINWSQLERIPEELQGEGESVLQQFKCGITGKCIRYLVCPRDHDVYYEKAELEQWLNRVPLQTPPNWPQGLEFKRANVETCRRLQYLIDNRLKQIAEDWKNTRQQPDQQQYTIRDSRVGGIKI